MNALFVVVPLALLVTTVAVIAFVWATRRGQFDDLETPAVRMLHDDVATKSKTNSERGDKPETD